MTYENQRYRNLGNDEGDVLNFFNTTVRNMIQKNGGDNTYSSYSEEFHEKDIPVPIGEKTRIMLTHPNHIISQFENGFINMEIEFEVGFENVIQKKYFLDGTEPDWYEVDAREFSDMAEINQIFVGFKDALEIISEAKFYCDGKLIQEYNQNEMIRESFAYNSIRSRESKINSPHSHSLWENVMNMSPNVCGVYIPLNHLLWENELGPKYVPIRMELQTRI